MEKKYKVALIQMDTQADYEKNVATAVASIYEAAANGAKLVVLPETFEYIGRGLAAHARTSTEQIEEIFAPIAKELGIYINTGSFTLKEGELPTNTALLIGPDGSTLGRYEKIHLFDVDVENGPSYHESKRIQAGDHLTVVESEIGTMGMAICYDIRFPQMFHLMAKKGAGIFVINANFTDPTGFAHWEPILRTRAIENGCYVLACDQCGKKPAFEAHGNSMIIDPWGRILARAGKESVILYADIDLNEVNRVRQDVPSLYNDRADLYTLTSNYIQITKMQV